MQASPELHRVIQVVAGVLLDTECIDQCVSGSAILLRSLRENGFPNSYPLSLGVKIVKLRSNGPGIMLGKGTDPMPGKWPGHLGVVVPKYEGEDHVLIDLTVVQINGEVPGIEVMPFVGVVNDAFLRGQEPNSVEADGCQLYYEAFPSDDSYVTSTNWSNIPGIDRAVAMVRARL